MEVSGYLVGSPAFKAGGTGDPRPAGSIPVHLRQPRPTRGSDRAAAGDAVRSVAGSRTQAPIVPTLRPMKKLLLLLALAGLLAVAAKKLRTA